MEINNISPQETSANILENKRNLYKEKVNHQKTLQKLRKKNDNEIEIESIKQKNNLISAQNQEKNKLETLRTQYANSLKKMKGLFDQELIKLRDSFLKSKTKLYGLDKDEFEDRISIETQVRQYPKYTELEVSIPRELSNQLFTTVNKREITLNLSRSFKDKYQEEGDSISFNKNQTITKKINVDEILSDKNITKVILEDKTIFKFAKA